MRKTVEALQARPLCHCGAASTLRVRVLWSLWQWEETVDIQVGHFRRSNPPGSSLTASQTKSVRVHITNDSFFSRQSHCGLQNLLHSSKFANAWIVHSKTQFLCQGVNRCFSTAALQESLFPDCLVFLDSTIRTRSLSLEVHCLAALPPLAQSDQRFPRFCLTSLLPSLSFFRVVTSGFLKTPHLKKNTSQTG